MGGTEQIPEPWRSFLRELDGQATEETRLECMGGFVVTVLYGFSRETSDLDVLMIAPGEQRTRNTRCIWITWALSKCRRTMRSGSRKCSPGGLNTCGLARWIPTIWRSPS